MSEVEFSTAVTEELRSELGDEFQVLPEYESETEGLQKVHDLVILEDGQIRIIMELEEEGSFESAKQELRKFYEDESGDEVFLLAACGEDRLAVFGSEVELLDREYDEVAPEEIASEIAKLLSTQPS